MAKTKISEFDIDPANNTDINSINIAEGCAPSGINNAIRQLMSDLKEFQTGAGGDPFNGAVNGTVGATTPNTGAFTTLSASGAFSANGGATLGDASGDALTINSSAVSIPNGLNFDSNTFVIDATNNRVGIGTSSPSQRLDVQVTGTNNVALLKATNGGAARLWFSDFYTSSDTSVGIGSINANAFHVLTGGTERMRIDSSGNVGIGTSSPSGAFHISRSANDLIVDMPNSGQTRLTSAYGASTGVMIFANGTGKTERMRIDDSGNLGLGVTPSAWSNTSVFEIGTAGNAIWSYAGGGLRLIQNARYNAGSWIYTSTAASSRYEQNAGSHAWYNAASGTAGNAITFTQAMTLDASGNLGVGTTTMNYPLTVAGASNGNTITAINNSSNISRFCFAQYGTPSNTYTNIEGDARSTGYLAFRTNDAERMRIDSSGNLLVGKTSQITNEKLGVLQTANANGISINTNNTSFTEVSFAIFANRNTTNNTFYAMQYYNSAAGVSRFLVADSGNVTNTNGSYGAISDIKLKENIVDATPKLEKLNQVRIVNYNIKGETQKQIGVVAQELEQIFPSMIDESPDRDAEGNDLGTTTKSVKYSVFVPMLIKAIQELKAEVDSLKAQLNK